jgi:ABC-type transporter Mla subunit MlaD
VRRLALICAVVAAALGGAVVVTTGASRGAGGPYEVRAIFDDAAFAVSGEDVRIGGANVGSVQSLDVTADNKAAVTISIDDARFTPFYANATCAIRPQSLIGERYVDCKPGSSSSPALTRIKSGPGPGTYYLPVTRTSSPVDSDIVQDIYQQPIRQRFALIINELGTGLAARGSDLNAVIHRANPALGNTDRVLKILAAQNKTLANLARDSDAVLAPLAKVKSQISGFVTQANTTSVASAARANDISRSFQLFPPFLRQLRPLLVSLGNLADQGTPLMQSLDQSSSALGRQFQNLTPFAKAARPALIALGNSSEKSEPALKASIPLANRLKQLGQQAVPTSKTLDKLTASLDNTGAIEQLMSVLFEGTSAANGFDAFGHYVRAEPLVGQCTTYVVKAQLGCSANFTGAGTIASATSASTEPVADASSSASDATGDRQRSGRAARAVHRPVGKPRAARPRRLSIAPRLAHQAQQQAHRESQANTLNGLLRYLIGNGR